MGVVKSFTGGCKVAHLRARAEEEAVGAASRGGGARWRRSARRAALREGCETCVGALGGSGAMRAEVTTRHGGGGGTTCNGNSQNSVEEELYRPRGRLRHPPKPIFDISIYIEIDMYRYSRAECLDLGREQSRAGK